MKLLASALLGAVVAATMASAADNTFVSTWKSPTAGPLNFGGRKVVALVIDGDESLRMSAEEALAREISARGPQGIAANRLVPREELADKDRAKAWFERMNVDGVVIMRIVDADTEKVYSAVVWSSGYYSNVWDYYGYGWTSVTPVGRGRNVTNVTVETLLYDLRSGNPIWAGVTRTGDVKDTTTYMKNLARDIGKQLEKEGLAVKKAR
jgi:hypothetical protein